MEEITKNFLDCLGMKVNVRIQNKISSQIKECYLEGLTLPQWEKTYLLGAFADKGRFKGVISCIILFPNTQHIVVVTPFVKKYYEPGIKHFFKDLVPPESRYFCAYEKSCGVIPYRFHNNQIEYLALHQIRSNTWSFPKGHVELGETELETAAREVFEEIGIHLSIPKDFRAIIHYRVHNNRALKSVILYACHLEQDPVRVQKEEIEWFRWLNRHDVEMYLGHNELPSILNNLEKLIKKKHQVK